MRTHRLSRKQIDGSSEEDPEPLGKLRRRCTAGAFTAAFVYMAAFITDIARRTNSDNMVVSGVEMAAVGLGALCGFIATVAWLLTENTKYALAIWKASSRAQRLLDAAVLEYQEVDMADTVEIPLKTIPINHGREIRRRRDSRRAV